MKLRVVRVLQRSVFNRPVRLLLRLGVVPPGMALLETTGRRTGKPRQTPVGDGRIGDVFWIVVEHGHRAAYVRRVLATEGDVDPDSPHRRRKPHGEDTVA